MLTKPNVIVEQFCANGIPGTDYIIPVQTSVDPDLMTQDNGIPISMATALTAMGVPVDRAQTNGYMYLYSWILAWIQFGGTFTFEPTVSTANGGYPAGTVLWAASVKNFVVSLINNNTNNFVSTPAYINDGINWSTLGFIEYPDITDVAGLVSIIGSGGLNVINALTVASIPVVTINEFGGNLTQYVKIPNYSPSGTTIIQFGSFTAFNQVLDDVQALPITFPNAFVAIIVSKGSSIDTMQEYTIGAQPLSNSTFEYTNSAVAPGSQGAFYIAIGY